ncbi:MULTISPECIES: hypothetical protein [unclassified Cellvibrio]|jgi:hypothetical protein|uniref:hypothetical protein n=1 Tax=unclassified Cellvibrio TaxID=2624793 RepID=UPI0012469BEB|nr:MULTISPECIES: hypothetical protein [unclassified Cellvibrio]QEY14049.1 hypothetical protein D0B88_18345 [Cellvibrio sp. KY-YJ-3]UUA74660.1 hypothetical protein NNX04_09505 [Cellvibrio sp. QJXJ]
MNEPDSVTTSKRQRQMQQCIVLRRQLEQQRQLLKQQWSPVDAQGEPLNKAQFPRSATMRFLTRSKHSSLLILFAKWQLARHFPSLVFWNIK